MSMTYIWAGIVIFSVIYGFISGNIASVGNASIEGAKAAVTICIGISAVTCLWSGLSEVMKKAGINAFLSKLLSPILKRLYPKACKNPEALNYIAANVSANMLGLGNAATPLGIKAAELISGGSKKASNELILLIVMNSASIQIIPTTIAAVRAQAGCSTPFDILPAVWATSACSVLAGISAVYILKRIWRA